jgi:hypothetical protein
MSLFGSGAKTGATASTVAAGINVQTSLAGTPIQVIYGANRASGNLIWYGDFIAQQGSSGAGKGGPTRNGQYTYFASFILGICQGPIAGVLRVWASQSNAENLGAAGLDLGSGALDQATWGYMSTFHPDQALPYSGLAYACSYEYPLGSSAELPNFNFEVLGIYFATGGPYGDANAAQVVEDFLTNPYYGAGLPQQYLGGMGNFSDYCLSAGLWISPVFNQNQDAASLMDDIVTQCNSAFVWSGSTLNLVPYGDTAIAGNGATWSPPADPLFSLTDDDFLADASNDPVSVERARPADQINAMGLEYLNRFNAYNPDLVWARDEASIAVYGLRQSSTPASSHYFCDGGAAQTSVNLQLARQAVRNKFTFKLGWQYCMLDPMDIVAITDVYLGIADYPVRILSVDESEWDGKDGGALTITAEDFLGGIGSTALYNFETGSGYQPNYNAAAPTSYAPQFLEPSFELSAGQPQVWMALAGPAGTWGGADVWVSFDGTNYAHLTTVSQNSRYGVTTTGLIAEDEGLDQAAQLGVNLSSSGGQLTASPGVIAAQANASLCWVSGEFLSYVSSNQTGTNLYTLSGLNRGQYDTIPAAAPAGSPFVRCDGTLSEITLQPELIGKPVFVKVLDKNAFGVGQPTLDEVEPYVYTYQGLAYTEPLPPIENLCTVFISNVETLSWDSVDDSRQPGYEVRQGASWGLGLIIGTTAETTFAIGANGTYWVAAKYIAPTGYVVYGAASSVILTGGIIINNLLASFDEAATGWTGTFSGTAIVGGNLELGGSGNILSASNILTEADILAFGGLGNSGTYAVPSAHVINAGRVLPATISISWAAEAISIYANLLASGDMLSMSDILGTDTGPLVSVTPQINVAQVGGTYAGWQNFTPGQYVGQYFDFQLVLATTDATINCVVTDFAVMTDVPDRIDTGANVAVPSGGLTIAYTEPFNNVAAVQVTIIGGSAGDTALITKTSTSFTVHVVNGGSGVARTIDWAAQGY